VEIASLLQNQQLILFIFPVPTYVTYSIPQVNKNIVGLYTRYSFGVMEYDLDITLRIWTLPDGTIEPCQFDTTFDFGPLIDLTIAGSSKEAQSYVKPCSGDIYQEH